MWSRPGWLSLSAVTGGAANLLFRDDGVKLLRTTDVCVGARVISDLVTADNTLITL